MRRLFAWFFRSRPERHDTGPVRATWHGEGLAEWWECGGCSARNGWSWNFCHFCQRMRSNPSPYWLDKDPEHAPALDD